MMKNIRYAKKKHQSDIKKGNAWRVQCAPTSRRNTLLATQHMAMAGKYWPSDRRLTLHGILDSVSYVARFIYAGKV